MNGYKQPFFLLLFSSVLSLGIGFWAPCKSRKTSNVTYFHSSSIANDATLDCGVQKGKCSSYLLAVGIKRRKPFNTNNRNVLCTFYLYFSVSSLVFQHISENVLKQGQHRYKDVAGGILYYRYSSKQGFPFMWGKFSGDWNYYTCLRYRMVGDVQTHIKGIDICYRTDIEEIDL